MTYARVRVMKASQVNAEACVPAMVSSSTRHRMACLEVEARAEAQRILAAARTEAEELVRDAGAVCERRAVEAERAARHRVAAEVAALVLRARGLEDRALASAEAELMQLGGALAARLLQAELELSPERIQSLARSALDEARGARQAVLSVHPDGVASLERALDELALEFELAQVSVRSDPELGPGDVVLESGLGEVDARLVTRLDRLVAAIRTNSL